MGNRPSVLDPDPFHGRLAVGGGREDCLSLSSCRRDPGMTGKIGHEDESAPLRKLVHDAGAPEHVGREGDPGPVAERLVTGPPEQLALLSCCSRPLSS